MFLQYLYTALRSYALHLTSIVTCCTRFLLDAFLVQNGGYAAVYREYFQPRRLVTLISYDMRLRCRSRAYPLYHQLLSKGWNQMQINTQSAWFRKCAYLDTLASAVLQFRKSKKVGVWKTSMSCSMKAVETGKRRKPPHPCFPGLASFNSIYCCCINCLMTLRPWSVSVCPDFRSVCRHPL